MNPLFPIHIKNNDRLLSDLDLHQIRNVLWLRLCSYEQHIAAAVFEMIIPDESEDDCTFKAICRTELFTGTIVESVAIAGSKQDAIVSLGKEISVDLPNRLRFEKMGLYRWISTLANQLTNVGAMLGGGADKLRPRPRQT